MKVYLAIDIGASSGRHLAGWMEDGELKTKEVFRFPNGVQERDGHLVWDMEALAGYVREGIDRALTEYGKIESFAIDTWGVDYVLMRGDEPVLPCVAYRDSRTEKIIGEVHNIVPFAELYRRTGCQFQPFNTVYQLFEDKKAGRLEGVTELLMVPEYLMYTLTGVKAREYTNATTQGLINAETGKFDRSITDALGLPRCLFPELSAPGTVIGEYKGIRAVLCATHDTGSAVEGIPMKGNEPYISSGTWSLLGVKTERPITDEGSMAANYSNEGGVGYNRYQKNIMGMWLINRLRAELCPDTDFGTITKMAEDSANTVTVDAAAQAFLAPESMVKAFDEATGGALHTPGDYFNCAVRSLALGYKTALEDLERNTGKKYTKLYIVGGGAKNGYLNRLTEEVSGKKVVALPIEATAIGNLRVQMKAG